MNTEVQDSARLIGWGLHELPVWVKAWLIGALVLFAALVAFFGAANPPDTSGPTSAEAATAIARTLHVPETADESLIGDFLVERVDIRDIETGQIKIGDVFKGKVRDVIVSRAGDWAGYDYRLVLDRNGMHAARDRVTAFISAVAPPPAETEAQYAGLVVQGGNEGVFRLNYSGRLPEAHVPFHGPEGENAFDFIGKQDYAETSRRLRLIGVEGNNYLLRSTADSLFYRNEFKVGNAIMLAELVIVDATAPSQAETFREITWNIPLRPVQ